MRRADRCLSACAVLLPAARLLQARGGRHAAVCAAADWQAVLGHGDGAVTHLAAHSRRLELVRSKTFLKHAQSTRCNLTVARPVRRFCAELVAACLQAGGLLNRDSNPGAATPQSLYRLYKGQAAAAANPYTLRNQFASMPSRAQSAPRMRPMPAAAPVFSTPLRCASASAPPSGGAGTSVPRPAPLAAPIRVNDSWRSTRPSEPPRAGLRVVHAGSQPSHVDKTLTLSLNSLNVRRRQ